MPYVRSTDGCRIHYDVTGRRSAPPVLMIQGLGMDKHGWVMQRLAFSWTHRVIAFDNRGSGRSDKPLGDYDLYQMAQDAVAVLDELGVDRAHVVGASMGGAIAQIVGVMFPDRVRSLSLVCTACRNLPWRQQLLAGWADAALTEGVGAMTGKAARWVIGPRSFRRLVVISGAAHGLMIEHASTFNRILGNFLHRAESAYQQSPHAVSVTPATAAV